MSRRIAPYSRRGSIGALAIAMVFAATLTAASQTGDPGPRPDASSGSDAAAATDPSKADPSAEDTFPIRVLQYNVQGAIRDWSSHAKKDGPADDHDFRFVDVLAERIVEEQPHVVTLQEICESQFQRLAALLIDRYPMKVAAQFTRNHPDCPYNEDFANPEQWTDGLGLAILTIGSGEQIGVPQGVRAICARWTAFGEIRVCTAHVDPPEVGAVAVAVGEMADASPVILTGDLNAEPKSAELSAAYASEIPGGITPGNGRFIEADMCHVPLLGDRCEAGGRPARGGASTFCRACIPDGPTGVYFEKFDYVFADTDHFSREVQATVEDTERQCGATRCSDHAMLWATVELIRPQEQNACEQSPDDESLLAVLTRLGISATRIVSKECFPPNLMVFGFQAPFGVAKSLAYLGMPGGNGGDFHVALFMAPGNAEACRHPDYTRLPSQVRAALGCGGGAGK